MAKHQIEIADGGFHKLHAMQGEPFFECGYCHEVLILDKISSGEFPITKPHTLHDDYEGKCTCGKMGITVNYPSGESPYAEYELLEGE